MKVKLLACTPKNHPFPILSWVIKFFQKTNYSHNAIAFGNVVYDATGKGVRINSSWDFRKRYNTVDEIELEIDEDFEKLITWCLLYTDRKYGFFQLVGIALKVLGFAKVNPFGNEDKLLICSELIILFLRDYKNLLVKDSDEYDLNTTWELAKQYR